MMMNQRRDGGIVVWVAVVVVVLAAVAGAYYVLDGRAEERNRKPWERLPGKSALETTPAEVGKAVGETFKAIHEEASRAARDVKKKVEENNR